MTTLTARRQFLRFLAASPLFSLMEGQESTQPTSPEQALNVFDFEAVARKNVPPAHFGYIATGVDDDRTLRENHEAYSRIRLRPRRLIDVSHVDTGVELFGTKWPTPLFLCPCGSQKAFHADGELASARAGASRRTLQILSTVTTVAVEEVIRAAGRPVWQQLYPTTKWPVMESIVRRAEAAGCPVLVITVDLPAGRNTETATRAKALDSRKCITCHPGGGNNARKPMFDGQDTAGMRLYNPAFTWDSVRRIRAITRMKILLKGIETGEDAKLAVEHGVDGIVVSNHGGRSEESGWATIDALPEVVAAAGSVMPVLVDGGVRRGTDIFKALALGARAVGIGRPYLWGMGAFGQPGVERVLDILRAELELAMAQCGTRSVEEIRLSNVIRG
jgi:isopentenyl diphosphate isomerase/L-lactate dehydrogenase-like FMN-dependent dehydrogenase